MNSEEKEKGEAGRTRTKTAEENKIKVDIIQVYGHKNLPQYL